MDGVSWSQLELVVGRQPVWWRMDLRVDSADLIRWRAEAIAKDGSTIALRAQSHWSLPLLESQLDEEVTSIRRMIEKRIDPF